MIDWRLTDGSKTVQGENWFFPSFEIQEYLLPILNPGKTSIDPYGDTTFQREDCLRMKANIDFVMESGLFSQRQSIRYDSFKRGL